MGSGMNLEQAKTYAEKMSYSQAVYNALCGYGIPYRKATKIKLNELLDVTKNIDARRKHKKEDWVSCSKRLPKENEYVDNVCKYYLIQDEYGDMHIAHYTDIGWIPIDGLYVIEDKVIAWRSLPEKYKAESEGDE